MTIKTKIMYGVIFLFAVSLTVGGLGIYYIQQISKDSKNIIKDNYESLEYMKAVILASELLKSSPDSLTSIEQNIRLQENNVTEDGELEQTRLLRKSLEALKTNPQDGNSVLELKEAAHAISEINMQAILRKNEIAQETASRASLYLIMITTIVLIVAFTFTVNFPGYIANPIAKLTDGIKSIANKKYEERLTFNREDEFEELAKAFNLMAEKLDEYEHSNLAKILFEKKRIETIINRMTDPVIGLDEKSIVVFANDQALVLLNLKSEMLIGRYTPDVAIQNDLLRTLLQSSDTASSLIKIVVDKKENYFSKEIIPIQYTATAEQQSIFIGQVILLKNVTSFKELDLAKTNFIATISHELKTPLASIQMGVKLLQDKRVGTLNGEQQTIIHSLVEEVMRLSKITNELLDLSQVETGKIKLDIQNVAIQELISPAIEAVKFLTEKKRIEIEVDVPLQIPHLLADVDKTIWVLVNLLTNAIRYSSVKGKMSIKCEPINKMINFSVIDQGPGIEAKYITRIFEKFYQVPGSPSGTGLGLAISKEFIEAQGGQIHVESSPGKGSTFSFQLPQG